MYHSNIYSILLSLIILHLKSDPVCSKSTCSNSAYSSTNGNQSPSNCTTCVPFVCIDWALGSILNIQREEEFFLSTGINVYFGTGSFTNDNKKAGLCYRISSSFAGSKDLIVQVTNQGGDVLSNNVDLFVGDGGFGLFNRCCGNSDSMYNGTCAVWGSPYGGVKTAAACNNLPEFSICRDPTYPTDNLRNLCNYSFTNGFRVKCPDQLWQATGLHRSDETNSGYTCMKGDTTPSGGIITRMMDCAKPSYGFAENVNGKTFPGYEQLVPCTRDGYTRVNSLAAPPVVLPTSNPSRSVSAKPTHAYSMSPTVTPQPFIIGGNSNNNDTSLSTSAIVGIVIGSFFGLVIIAAIISYILFGEALESPSKEVPNVPVSESLNSTGWTYDDRNLHTVTSTFAGENV